MTEEDYFKNISDPDHFIIIANILVPPFRTKWHNFSYKGWTVVPPSGGYRIFKIFEKTSKIKDWAISINDLNNMLLSYLLVEFEPRKIYSFKIFNHYQYEPGFLVNLLNVFGNLFDDNKSIQDEIFVKSSSISGLIFLNSSDKPNEEIDIETLNEWCAFLEKNTLYYNTVKYINESFIIFNRLFKNISYYDHFDLTLGVMLLVSALENLFTFGQNNTADIIFKFQLIGSLYYEKNVTDDFLNKISNPHDSSKKFNQTEFRDLLKKIYDMRSDIAHGSYIKFYKNGTWKSIFKYLGVLKGEKEINNLDYVYVLRHIPMAFCLFQKHILALLIQSKNDFIEIDDKGEKINLINNILEKIILEKDDIQNNSKDEI